MGINADIYCDLGYISTILLKIVSIIFLMLLSMK
jgi:hypothetical protein